MALITTAQAAQTLGISVARVHQFIRAGRIPAKKMGRDWFIERADLALVRVRKPGRPPGPQKKK